MNYSIADQTELFRLTLVLDQTLVFNFSLRLELRPKF